MSIPKITESDWGKFLTNQFSRKVFNETYVKALEKFYKKDDNGNPKEEKTGLKKFQKAIKHIFINNGYDSMYERVLVLSKKLDESSLKKFVAGLKKIKKEFEHYLKSKDKEKNKSKYVEELNRLLGDDKRGKSGVIGELVDWLELYLGIESEVKELSNRDIAGYLKGLNKYTHFPEIAKLVKCFLNELAERSKDKDQKKDIEKHLRTTSVY